jgi:hypothetical protein
MSPSRPWLTGPATTPDFQRGRSFRLQRDAQVARILEPGRRPAEAEHGQDIGLRQHAGGPALDVLDGPPAGRGDLGLQGTHGLALRQGSGQACRLGATTGATRHGLPMLRAPVSVAGEFILK